MWVIWILESLHCPEKSLLERHSWLPTPCSHQIIIIISTVISYSLTLPLIVHILVGREEINFKVGTFEPILSCSDIHCRKVSGHQLSSFSCLISKSLWNKSSTRTYQYFQFQWEWGLLEWETQWDGGEPEMEMTGVTWEASHHAPGSHCSKMYLNKENVSPSTGPISLIMVASIYYR